MPRYNKRSNNLSDVRDAAAARSNLDLKIETTGAKGFSYLRGGEWITVGPSRANVLDFEAKADSGITSNKSKFAAAIAAVASYGGEVYVPRCDGAYYGFGNTAADYIEMSPYVKLKGESTKDSYKRFNGGNGVPLGSILGFTSTLAPGIIIADNSTDIEGLTFYYPNQNTTGVGDPYTYYPTITQPGAHTRVNDVRIDNCCFLNSFDGIAMKDILCDGLWISRISGAFLHYGIEIDKQEDWVTIHDVFDHPVIWTYDSNIIAYQEANKRFLIITGAVQGSMLISLGGFAFIELKDAQGHFTNLGNDNYENGIIVNGTNLGGVTVTGWDCACTGSGYGISFSKSSSRLQVSNSRFWGTYTWQAINTSGGFLSLTDIIFDGEGGALACEAGELYMKGIYVPKTTPHGSVSITSGCSIMQWIGGKQAGPYSNAASSKRIVAVSGISDA